MAGAGGGGGGVVRDVEALDGVRSIVLKPSESLDESRFTRIAGADFNDPGLGLEGLLASLAYTGFQASNLGDAIDVVNQMVRRPLLCFFPCQNSGGRVCAWGHCSNLAKKIGPCDFVRWEFCCRVLLILSKFMLRWLQWRKVKQIRGEGFFIFYF